MNSWTASASKLSFLLFGLLRILLKSIVAMRDSRRLAATSIWELHVGRKPVANDRSGRERPAEQAHGKGQLPLLKSRTVSGNGPVTMITRALKRTNGAGFNVSARAIMGGSKVLSAVDSKAMQALGLPARLKTSSPRYVVCAGPQDPVATLLIENPRAFENAVRSGLGETVALVCTYGFGLSYLGQVWAEDMHSDDQPIQIIRAGAPRSLSTLLTAKNVYLWADLDLAALSIYKSLKTAIPQLQFSAIYLVMIEMLKDGKRSHPYAAIFEKDGQVSNTSLQIDVTDSVANAIYESCRVRAVDQEAVPENDIFLHGGTSLRNELSLQSTTVASLETTILTSANLAKADDAKPPA